MVVKTVKELKKELENVPDDYLVTVCVSYYDDYENDLHEIFSDKMHRTNIQDEKKRIIINGWL